MLGLERHGRHADSRAVVDIADSDAFTGALDAALAFVSAHDLMSARHARVVTDMLGAVPTEADDPSGIQRDLDALSAWISQREMVSAKELADRLLDLRLVAGSGRVALHRRPLGVA